MRTALCAALAVLCGAAQAAPVDVYLIAGQSNAVGHAPEAPPEALAKQDVPYEFWIHSGSPTLVAEPMELQTLRPYWPLYQWSSYGPELSLAHALEQRGRNVAVVKVAQGGVNAFAWQPGVTGLFDQLVWSAREMAADLTARGDEPRIAGLVWVQGEADAAQNAWTRDNYDRHLRTLFNELRGQLGPFPIVLNRLHSGLDPAAFPYGDHIRQVQDELAATLPDVGVVRVDGLPLNSDGVHFAGATQIALGRLAANWFAPSGDFNFDGLVNETDLALWSVGQGDADGNGDTGGDDLLIWQRQYQPASIVPPVSVAAVPEPAGGALVLTLLSGGALWRSVRGSGGLAVGRTIAASLRRRRRPVT